MRNRIGESLLGLGFFGGLPATGYAFTYLPIDAGIVTAAITAFVLWLGWSSERFEDRREQGDTHPLAVDAMRAIERTPAAAKAEKKGARYWVALAFVFVVAALSQGIVRVALTPKKVATPAPATEPPIASSDAAGLPPGFTLDPPPTWDSLVSIFLEANCDMRDKDNLALMQQAINEIDARIQLRDADLLARAVDRVRIDSRYRRVDCR